MNGPLRGRVAIVTGAGRNIGAAVAMRLAAAGAAVAVNYPDEQSGAEAARVVARIAGAGGRAMATRADVSQEAEIQAMVAETIAAFGHPDILINNAAISVAAQAPWSELTGEAWDHVLRVNVTGAYLCARALYRSMRARGGGHIVNLSSVTALLGRTGNLHYVTSKAALIGFTRALAREVGGENIRVNALILGAIRTPDEAVYGSQEEVDAQVLPLQSLKRRGDPADVGGAISFLVSADADFITGQCITVDGGWVMH